MWIRYKNWQQISEQEQVKVAYFGKREYRFWHKDNGLCDVKVRKDVERLLNPLDTTSAKYEIAYEKYGIFWDDFGNQIGISSDTTAATETNGVHSTANLTMKEVAPESAKKRVSLAIQKMREARNRNRIEKGKKPIEFKP